MLTILGHRGSHRPDEGPVENTLEAFEAALAEGADAVELEVWRTLDGREVVHHDEVLPDGRRVRGLVAAEVCAARLPRGGRVPTLDDALDLLAGRTIVHVELKHRAVLEGAVRAVRRFRAESDVVFSSFSRRAMFDAADMAPGIPRAVAMGTPVLNPNAVHSGAPLRLSRPPDPRLPMLDVPGGTPALGAHASDDLTGAIRAPE